MTTESYVFWDFYGCGGPSHPLRHRDRDVFFQSARPLQGKINLFGKVRRRNDDDAIGLGGSAYDVERTVDIVKEVAA